MKRQLWVHGTEISREKMRPFSWKSSPLDNVQGIRKPKGGLWTSTYIPERGSAWTQWCLSEDFSVPQERWQGYVLTPRRNTILYTIDTYEDYERLLYDLILWARMLRREYDGVHLTERGESETRRDLYGWDCESTFWFKWSFSHIEYIEIPIGERVHE